MEVINVNDANERQEEEKKRGIWLTGLLVLIFIANPITAYSYLTNADLLLKVYPAMTTGVLRLLVLLALVNIVLAAAVWEWRKWGVFGFYGVTITAFAINLYIGIGVPSAIFGLTGAVLMFLTTRGKWKHFS